ncbi:ATP-dependent helicase [Salinispira pacifica]|uniref:DNA 3'-5' helicase n=1 Tax=Salinispira pacifica TaxID=1307761 RepID=V5WDH9_9SPIO|nr:ATP-dependent DNA helicase UvrD/PcrA [Salinispira pacifica]
MKPIHESLELLNEQQRNAVLHKGSALLILAGAGSGKTRVITVKIAYLIEELGVDPRSILAVTFTNKAAGEMRERARDLSEAAEGVVIRTFHSFGAWLMRRNAAALNLSSNFTIYDDDDSLSLLATLYPEKSRQQLKQYNTLISRAKDSCLGPDDSLEDISGDPELQTVYAAYERRLREIGNSDFGDLILRPIELLQSDPAIAERIRNRFSVILVDEYQDSNHAQYRLLSELYRPGSYICVVGDDDQSIYRFRGAEVKNILNFPELFDNTDIIKLEQNYRSTNPILELAGSVVANNQGRLGKQLWTSREDGALPVIARLSDSDAEVDYVLRLIRDDFEGETAILYRTNAQSRLFETRFLQEGIPYRIVGTLRFYEREEIKDAVALLKLIANPKDEVSFNRIINKPSRGIGKSALADIKTHLHPARGNLVLAAEYAMASARKRTSTGIAAFLDVIRGMETQLKESGGGHLGELINSGLERSGLAQYYINQDEIAGSTKIQNLEELVNAASLYSPDYEGLVEFLEAIELDSSREQSDEDAMVTLITMHNTKGLEFDRVVITGLEDDLFPRADNGDPDALEEERRLFYVAITRARHELHITSCASRRIHGRIQRLNPSRFLGEIPGELVEFSGRSAPDTPGDPSSIFSDEDPWAAWSRAGQGEPGFSRHSGGKEEDVQGDYPRGQAVYHDDYGPGEVIKSMFNGSEEVIIVRFQSGQTAQFIPRFSGIEKISSF